MFDHDIEGWRRDRVPETLAAHGVPFYWVADVERENLLVFKLVGDHYALINNLFRTDTKARIEPFEAAELNIDVFFGADAED